MVGKQYVYRRKWILILNYALFLQCSCVISNSSSQSAIHTTILFSMFSTVVNQLHGISSVQFSHLVVFDSLQPHGLQHRPPCPSPTPRVYSNSSPLSQWCHPTIYLILCLIPSPAFNLSQHQDLFQWVSTLQEVAKVLVLQLQHQSFNEYSGLISFRIDWLDFIAVQETLKSLPQHYSLKALSLLYIQFSHLTRLLEFIYLGIFQSNCAIVHNAAINTSVHIFLYKFRSYFETWT